VSRVKEDCNANVLVLEKVNTLAPVTARVTGLARLFNDNTLECAKLPGGVLIMNLIYTIPAGLNECYPLCHQDFVVDNTGVSMAVEEDALVMPYPAEPFSSRYSLIYVGNDQR
jgi:hypothetical protein